MFQKTSFIFVASSLDQHGLSWQPEVGDEVSRRDLPDKISILVDAGALSVKQLRQTYIWLPTVEQIVNQLEMRQAILSHAGLELDEKKFHYKAVIDSRYGLIEVTAPSLREALGLSLLDLINFSGTPLQ